MLSSQYRDVSSLNHDPLHAGEPRTREREAEAVSGLAPHNCGELSLKNFATSGEA